MLRPIVVVDPGLREPHGPSQAQRRWLERVARVSARRLGIHPEARGDIVVRVCDDAAIADLKQRFFGARVATDVLSFPGPGTDGRGDVAISWPTARRQAAAHRIRVEHEAAILLVHAFCHLLGHDHAGAVEGRRMHQRELRVLRALGIADLPRSYGRSRVREAG